MGVRLLISSVALVAILWAVPQSGTARFIARAAERPQSVSSPATVRLRVSKDRGLLVTGWINNAGPYVFAIDTGAGMNLLTERIVREARLATRYTSRVVFSGLSGVTNSSSREATGVSFALGNQTNFFPPNKTAIVVNSLATGVDGIIDPTDVYAPGGYSIDMPQERMDPWQADMSPGRGLRVEGATVPWLRLGDSDRPFVRLGDGRLALLDTGSGFGLAVNQRDAVIVGRRDRRQPPPSQDVGGGYISSRRVEPTTISIGELVLQRVPTDVLSGINDDAPVILGRDALYPFKMTFDPRRHLIEFATSIRS